MHASTCGCSNASSPPPPRASAAPGETIHCTITAEDDPAAGEVLFAPAASALRKMPAHTWRVRLFAVDDAGERALAEYTYAHAPG